MICINTFGNNAGSYFVRTVGFKDLATAVQPSDDIFHQLEFLYYCYTCLHHSHAPTDLDMLCVTRRGGGRVLLQIEAIFFLLAGTSSLPGSVTKKINR
jgi:hypothetical protein